MNRASCWRLARRLPLLVLVMFVCATGCGDDDGFADAEVASMEHPTGTDSNPATAAHVNCGESDQGTPCGDKKYCVLGHCVVNTCGDGVKAGGEECDDANVAPGDGCDPSCRPEPTGCGNGKVDGDEECDDGNRIDNDKCSNTCMKNACGNKRLDVGEECDDGNKIDNDKCSNSCMNVRCRNGRIDPGEECDDGNESDDDGCTNACKKTHCGNGKVEKYEECDDGNTIDTDKCSNRCLKNVCGNQRVDPGEQCDGESNCDPVKCVPVADKCKPCEEVHCRNYMDTGLDVVAGCREGKYIQAASGGEAAFEGEARIDPAEFAKLCIATVNCARMNKCASISLGNAGTKCFCGSATLDECTLVGPSGGACIEAYYQGFNTRRPDVVVQTFVDFHFPAGWANWLLQCDYEQCREECLPGTAP